MVTRVSQVNRRQILSRSNKGQTNRCVKGTRYSINGISKELRLTRGRICVNIEPFLISLVVLPFSPGLAQPFLHMETSSLEESDNKIAHIRLRSLLSILFGHRQVLRLTVEPSFDRDNICFLFYLRDLCHHFFVPLPFLYTAPYQWSS